MSLLGVVSIGARPKAPKNEDQPEAKQKPAANAMERSLTLLVEGAALAVPEIDAAAYRDFRGNVSKLALQLPDRLPEEDKLALIRSIVHEFDVYRNGSEAALRNRAAGWRALVNMLILDLLKSLGISESASSAAQLLRRLASVTTAEEIETLNGMLEAFLHPKGAGSAPAEASQFRKADHSTENDNAAGLRGGGSAVEHVRRIMERGGRGFIVLFRLSCLNMIHQRFGAEAVEDCLMAVSAFLTQCLHSDDATYHWSDSSLLSILQGRVNEQILTAELERIVLKNRETSVNIGGRTTMLRIPITFDIVPIDRLETPEDLLKINLLATAGSQR
ncbi:MAG: diguanylate cyclase [Terracidiphilus sp.]